MKKDILNKDVLKENTEETKTSVPRQENKKEACQTKQDIKNTPGTTIQISKEKNGFMHKVYWILGKFILFIQLGLYLWSMKCMLLDIIPHRVNNSYLDWMATSIMLLGYILTLRSLLLGCFTECGTVVTKDNQPTLEQRKNEESRRFQESELRKQLRQLENELKNLNTRQNKTKKGSLCARRNREQDQKQHENCEITAQQKSKSSTGCLRRRKNFKANNSKFTGSNLESLGSTLPTPPASDTPTPLNEEREQLLAKLKLTEKSIKQSHELRKSSVQICLKCNLIRSNDEHHCSMCNKCVPQMDHHCFFLGQCVGKYNYSYFLSYAGLSIIMTWLNFPFLFLEMYYFVTLNWDYMSIGFIDSIVLLLASGLFAFFTLFLFISHLYYISNEITYLQHIKQLKQQNFSPLEWICVIFKCQGRQKLGPTFSARWFQIFNTHSIFAIFFPEPNRSREIDNESKQKSE